MDQLTTKTVRVVPRVGTLDEFAQTAARWWAKRVATNGNRLKRSPGSGTSLGMFRQALTTEVRNRALRDAIDLHVWMVESKHPLLLRLAREAGIVSPSWPSGIAMELSLRGDAGTIRVLQDGTWTVLYDKTIEHP